MSRAQAATRRSSSIGRRLPCAALRRRPRRTAPTSAACSARASAAARLADSACSRAVGQALRCAIDKRLVRRALARRRAGRSIRGLRPAARRGRRSPRGRGGSRSRPGRRAAAGGSRPAPPRDTCASIDDDGLFLAVNLGAAAPAIAAVAWAIVCSNSAVSSASVREGDALGGDALAQLLDLALGGEDAARFGLVAAGHHVLAAEDVAFDRRHRERHERRHAGGGLERLRDQRVANRRAQRRRERAADARRRSAGARCRPGASEQRAVVDLAGLGRLAAGIARR